MFKKYIEYIKDNPKGYWFKAKLFGWGWTPATWQGWVVTAIFLACVLFFALKISDDSTLSDVLWLFVFPILALTSLFIYIAYKTGEKPRWQWGLRKK